MSHSSRVEDIRHILVRHRPDRPGYCWCGYHARRHETVEHHIARLVLNRAVGTTFVEEPDLEYVSSGHMGSVHNIQMHRALKEELCPNCWSFWDRAASAERMGR